MCSERHRPPAGNQGPEGVTAATLHSVDDGTDYDPHCCGRLSLTDLATCARFHIACGVDRCAFDVLGRPA